MLRNKPITYAHHRFIFLVALMLAVPIVAAETVYVTDELRLGLHNTPDGSDAAFRMLTSGTQLEVLGRTQYYARVRTADGIEGWTKAGYLITEKPARARLLELEAEVAGLTERLQSADSELRGASDRVAGLQEQAFAATSSAAESAEELDGLRSENERLRARLGGVSIPLSWAVILAVLAGFAGMAGGRAWIDHQNRKRHGGFRLY